MKRVFFAVAALIVAAGCNSYDSSSAEGNLLVIVTTIGTPDPNGYSLAVTGQAARPLASTDTTEYFNLPIGDYTVVLHGAEAGCTVMNDSTRAVYQSIGTKEVDYAVNCP